MDKKKWILIGISIIGLITICLVISILVLFPSNKTAKNLIESAVANVPESQEINSDTFEKLSEQAIWGNGNIEQASISPDGKQFAIASATGLYLFDTKKQELLHKFEEGSWITAVNFSHDGSSIAAGTMDGLVTVWQISDGKMLVQFDGNHAVQEIVFSPDDTMIAAGTSDGGMYLWGIDSKKQFVDGGWKSWAYVNDAIVTAVAFSPDGSKVAYGANEDDDCFIRIWDTTTMDVNSEAKNSCDIFDLDFSPDGNTLIVTNNNDIKLFDMQNGYIKTDDGKWDADGDFFSIWKFVDEKDEYKILDTTALAFSPNGKEIAAGYDNGIIRIYNADNGKIIRTISDEMISINAIQYASDGSSLITTSSDNHIRIFSSKNYKLLAKYSGFTSSARDMVFSPDGTLLATGGADGSIEIRQTSDGTLIHRLSGHTNSIRGLSFSREGDFLFSASGDQTIRKWRVSDGKLMEVMKNEDIIGYSSVATLPDGFLLGDVPLLASGSYDGAIQLWGVPKGNLINNLKSADKLMAVYDVAFSPDGTLLAAGLSKGGLQLWQPITGESIANIQIHGETITAVTFSSDSSTIVTGSVDEDIITWNLDQIGKPSVLGSHNDTVIELFYLDNDKYLLSAANNGEIRLWDMTNRKLLATLDSPFTELSSIEISPDGSLLVISLPDGTLHIWSARQ